MLIDGHLFLKGIKTFNYNHINKIFKAFSTSQQIWGARYKLKFNKVLQLKKSSSWSPKSFKGRSFTILLIICNAYNLNCELVYLIVYLQFVPTEILTKGLVANSPLILLYISTKLQGLLVYSILKIIVQFQMLYSQLEDQKVAPPI